MQLFTDPTYLRTIHDGLVTGTVNKDNASSLPYGLVGVYEEALPPLSLAADRQKFNEFFAVWALLKKEVSAAFTVPLLAGWTEDQVIGYIAKYSKWFNSPVSGMYVLYHERLRTFVLNRISSDHFESCNEAIIRLCQKALEIKSNDECENYCLEFLSKHLLTQGMASGDCASLMNFCRSPQTWNRQIEVSAGIEWTKNTVYDLIDLNSKYNPYACQIDYHNLLKIYRYSIEYIHYFNNIKIDDLNDLDILRLQNVLISNEYEAQFLYVSVIIKMHQCLKSRLNDDKISALMSGLDMSLSKPHSIEHGTLNFHDVLPLKYFEEVLGYYKSQGRNHKYLLATSYEFAEFETGDFKSHSDFDEFILKNQTFDHSFWKIPDEIDTKCAVVSNSFLEVDLSEIACLSQLYSVIEKEELNDIPISILIVPILFRKVFLVNPNYNNIKTEWIEESINEVFTKDFEIRTMAFVLLKCCSDIKCDKDELNHQITWFATHELIAHKFNFDCFLLFVCEYKYWKEGSSFFEKWLLQVLFGRKSVEHRAMIEDQKYQVIIDLYWDNKFKFDFILRQHISPFLVGYYQKEFDKCQKIVPQEELPFNEISKLSPIDILTHDFGCGPYYRNLGSVNSPMSVKNVDWLSVLPRLRYVDKGILYATMHKIFLKALCYSKANDSELPMEYKAFYDLFWLDSVLDD